MLELSEELENFLMENSYLNIIDQNTVEIRTDNKKHRVTISDVIQYYLVDARNITSGCRSLGSILGDWRPIDNLTKTVLEIFKEINPEELKAEGERNGMTLRD